jgi:peptidyl-prolyl cis-trans isomerase-like protein 2
LIALHYSRKEATGEIHDPISFKPFSEHSHIVAIATTGNVFLADSIKGGKDLVNDVPFKKYDLQIDILSHLAHFDRRADVITLQNPHGLPPASVANPSAVVKAAESTKPAPPKAVAALKSKEPVPCSYIASIS